MTNSHGKPSPVVPDWSREHCGPLAWEPSRQLLRTIRDYQQAKAERGLSAKLRAKIAVLRHRFWSAIAGADIPLNSSGLGGGLMLPHPNGVVVHPDVVVGPNCLLFQQVTLGTGPKPGVPVLGGAVEVGPGARILGGVVVGDCASIGANAVVTSDVPAGAIAKGTRAAVKNRQVLSQNRPRAS